MKDQMIQKTIKYIEDLFSDDYGGHDVEHTKRVYRNALMIAQTEPECDLFIVSLGALLHDADDHKLFHTENNANARAFMESLHLEAAQIESICELINGISFSKNRGQKPATLEGQIVQDADRLDAIGAIGIARTFAFGGERKRPLHATVQHFYDKLLLLKDEMNTEEGKSLAEHRHTLMVSFLNELHQELRNE